SSTVVRPASARDSPVKVATAPASSRSRQKALSRAPGSNATMVSWITATAAAHRRPEGDFACRRERRIAAHQRLVQGHLHAGRGEGGAEVGVLCGQPGAQLRERGGGGVERPLAPAGEVAQGAEQQDARHLSLPSSTCV